MNENDSDLKDLLDSTEVDATPDPVRAHAVRQRMMSIAGRARTRRPRIRTGPVAALVVIGAAGIGLAATETGRSILRWIVIPIQKGQVIKWEAPDGGVWAFSESDRSEPYSVEEEEAAAKEFAEYNAIQQAGGGRVTGLIEGPGFSDGETSHTTYQILYTLSSGETREVGGSRPTGKQAENMRIDEIMRLRDAGAGEIVEERPFPIGLGSYVIRFTLSDGETIDLRTGFPPSTREERARIFAEMRKLKEQLRFTVLNPRADAWGVWGLLRYRLADGRVVGATERVPPEAISEDGTHVVLPDLEAPIAIEGAAGEAW
ncbi:MAG: hypothetical protein JXQ75_10835 [Phycisphaerae bacterium]|nr:hypothetical protein [Phycisphaerae bacterium]